MTKKTASQMTRREFAALPYRKSWCTDVQCRALVILPSRRKHDSGYLCMDFAAVDEKDVPFCRLSGGSDVIHFDGIGGYGHNWLEKYSCVPSSVEPSGWNIDCLPKSGLLRIFCRGTITCGAALSSFEIYSTPKEAK